MRNVLTLYLNRERVMGDGIILSFDPKNVHVELIVHLFGSINCHMKRHEPFFDPKNGYAKQHIGYFCRGVLHTPPQDVPKRNV